MELSDKLKKQFKELADKPSAKIVITTPNPTNGAIPLGVEYFPVGQDDEPVTSDSLSNALAMYYVEAIRGEIGTLTKMAVMSTCMAHPEHARELLPSITDDQLTILESKDSEGAYDVFLALGLLDGQPSVETIEIDETPTLH